MLFKFWHPQTAPFQHRTSPLFFHYIIVLLWNSKSTSYSVIPALTQSPIHPFRSSSTHNPHTFPTLSTILSKLFHNISLTSPFPSMEPYPTTTTQTLTLENMNLIYRIVELTHPKFIKVLFHTSFSRMDTHSLALSIS